MDKDDELSMLSIQLDWAKQNSDRHLWYDFGCWWPKALYVFVMARPKLRALRQMPMTTRICENVIFSPQNFKEFLSGSYVAIETAHNERRKIMTKQHIYKKKKEGQRERHFVLWNKTFILFVSFNFEFESRDENTEIYIKTTHEHD